MPISDQSFGPQLTCHPWLLPAARDEPRIVFPSRMLEPVFNDFQGKTVDLNFLAFLFSRLAKRTALVVERNESFMFHVDCR